MNSYRFLLILFLFIFFASITNIAYSTDIKDKQAKEAEYQKKDIKDFQLIGRGVSRPRYLVPYRIRGNITRFQPNNLPMPSTPTNSVLAVEPSLLVSIGGQPSFLSSASSRPDSERLCSREVMFLRR